VTVLAEATGANVAFWIIAVVMAAAAIAVVTVPNVVHAALSLVIVLGGVAAQFILLQAEFVGLVQVLIYIGAVIILFLFGIMLTRAPMKRNVELDNNQRGAAAAVAFLNGYLQAIVGFGLFCVVMALALESLGLGWALTAALAAQLAWHAILVSRTAHSAPVPGSEVSAGTP
jgi:NADH:ubiquinone oxidoreductase subunit 6 (subunit J)